MQQLCNLSLPTYSIAVPQFHLLIKTHNKSISFPLPSKKHLSVPKGNPFQREPLQKRAAQPSFLILHSVPFCSVLFCSVLFCSVLFRSVLFCSVLFRSVLFCSILKESSKKSDNAYRKKRIIIIILNLINLIEIQLYEYIPKSNYLYELMISTGFKI